VGRLVPAADDARSEVSEWELRERREREEERGRRQRRWVPRTRRELPLFLPTPSFMASAGEE